MNNPFDVFYLVETCDCEEPVVTGYDRLEDAQYAAIKRTIETLLDVGNEEEMEYVRSIEARWKGADSTEARAQVYEDTIALWDDYEGANWLAVRRLEMARV